MEVQPGPPGLPRPGPGRPTFPCMRTPKTALALLLISLASASKPDLSEAFFLNGDSVILFLGDSITANGGYLKGLQTALLKRHPGMKAKFVNAGISGEAMPGLLKRADSVLRVNKPDLVFSSYGMNDGGYNPMSPAKLKSYQDGVATLKAKVDALGVPLILMTPTAFDSLTAVPLIVPAPPYSFRKFYANYDSVLTAYGNTVAGFRAADQMVIDIQNPLREWAKAKRKTEPDFAWTSEGVHPTAAGHQLMADAIYAALFPAPSALARRGIPSRTVPGLAGSGYSANGARIRVR